MARSRVTRSAPRCSSTTSPTPTGFAGSPARSSSTSSRTSTPTCPQVEAKLQANGVNVHWAATAEAANEAVLAIMRARGATKMVKAKTMVSEETELGAVSREERHRVRSRPTSASSSSRSTTTTRRTSSSRSSTRTGREIAASFEKHGLGAYNDDPQTITRRARQHLRGKYLAADVGLTGANFVSAESGRLVLVTNEGNSRFCLAGDQVPHRDGRHREDRAARPRPRALPQPPRAQRHRPAAHGLHRVHLRPEIAGAARRPRGDARHLRGQRPHRRARQRLPRHPALHPLRRVPQRLPGLPPGQRPRLSQRLSRARSARCCRRCWRATNLPQLADLPRASSLCGACNEVCPVDIPIPDLLLRLRDRAKQEGVPSPGTPPMGAWALLASRPAAWRAALFGGKLINHLPVTLVPVPALRAWEAKRTLPEWRGGAFRTWLKDRRTK